MMNAKRSSKYNLTRYAFLIPAVVALLLVFSISKAAFVKKTIPAIKTFSTVSSKAAEKGMLTVTATVNNASVPVIEMLKANFVSFFFFFGVFVFFWKGGFFLSTSGKSDSLNYVINGVKSTKAELMKLDEKKISSVNIMSGDAASKVMDNLDKTQNAIFVTTNDSEAGKKFKEKADRVLGNYYSVNNSGRSASGRGSYTIATGISGNDDNYATINGVKVSGASGTSLSMDDDGVLVVGATQSKPAKVQAYNYLTTADGNSQVITVQGRPANRLRILRSKNDTLQLKSQPFTLYTDTGIVSRNQKLTTAMAYTVKSGGVTYDKSHVSYTYSSERFSLDHIADKLIIINGNISSENDLKKISAFDIDKVVFKNDDETKELYGDKAKKGIVFIVTKKK